ncbi:DUF4868 domain-containing protein [Listeria seeligeri]|uniref:Kiwa anti-phage protein KwaB-like domain-containing protein n=1 Tax=Listeria TaxID=1637 RepID=UPI00162A3855|nr:MULTISPECIES: Kiwa anti-phage protein KwaB-like domain-containing protein [Listeria]MBC1532071.1 DUF4868 domain-containing protein [Listeria seeligeri]MBC1827116.1 DUF4868 domain-containing protein [Listeria seeligeri]MBC1840092.1 DUF4868 domain-containing protein [Listeria seeligeri]MBC6141904.1 DUF4868 domain-containing protein [Listeria seeligeri]MBC6302473.1 DUF4868 domain-containing protein [Listeria immobilis]
MELGNVNHPINRILQLENFENINIEIFYISVTKTLDCIYKSCDILVEKDVKKWYLNHTITNLRAIKKDSEFKCFAYNNEISIHDQIAVIDTKEQKGPIKDNLDLMRKAMIDSDGEMSNQTKFHLLKINIDSKDVYFGYYKGVKKQNAKRKYLFLIEGKNFKSIDNKIVELGGNIDFIILEEKIYVINPRNFEFAFLYSDHITKKRDKNLEKITELDIFKNDHDKYFFRNGSSHHLMARGIAQIKGEDLKALKNNFNERCKELLEIKNTIQKEPEKEEILKSELGVLIDLTNYIDFEDNKIIFNEGDDPKPLLYLFEDKIMKSFLTEKVTTILAKHY